MTSCSSTRQHSLFSLETIGHLAQVGLGCGTAVLVRARSCDDPDISLMLDNGVTGIIFPDVNTAAQARRAVDACKFAPHRQALGRAAAIPISTTGRCRWRTACAPSTTSTLVVCMIETREGLRQCRGDRGGRGRRRGACGLQRSAGRHGQARRVRRSGGGGGGGAGDRGRGRSTTSSPGSAASATSSARSASSRRASASSPRRPTSAS